MISKFQIPGSCPKLHTIFITCFCIMPKLITRTPNNGLPRKKEKHITYRQLDKRKM